ncbi:MAG: metallophosphoesterase, partial [Lachnospiraceae bacterium]|nr:metallophosphoesterase [Lachnospiraceae bacterium]
MIYITGDCHGHYKRFTKKRFPTQRMMSKQDYVIVCGDFGLWDRSKKQEYYRKWLNGRNFTLLWVDGNHENYDMLKEYEIVEWKGGKVQFINPSIIHLMRGQIYEIDGLKIFTFGGARCHDIEGGVLELDDEHLAEKSIELEKKGIFYRVNHQSWWAEEMPSREERDEGIHNLGKYQNEVDYIITHCAPTSIQNYFTEGNYVTDELTDYLEGLKGSIKFKKWYFGHYHDNRIFEEKFCLLYKHIELLEDKAEDSGSAGSKTEDRGNAESRLPDGIPETKTEYRRNTESKPADGIAETKTEDSRNAE